MAAPYGHAQRRQFNAERRSRRFRIPPAKLDKRWAPRCASDTGISTLGQCTAPNTRPAPRSPIPAYLVTNSTWSRSCETPTMATTAPAAFDASMARGRRLRTDARQVLIRWRIQLGNIVVPKSVNPHESEQLQGVRFRTQRLDLGAETALFFSLNDGTRLGPESRTFNFTGR